MGATDRPVDGGFRLRGQQVTRLETFVDAAFAFSLTLLVIFHDSVPGSMEEVRIALRRIPTFVACFVLIAMFWAAHNRWSRRFGLDDTRSTVLSLSLVLAVLVYVYPLRMVVSQALSLFTGGWVPSEIGAVDVDPVLDAQTIFIVYSSGFGLLSGLLWRLNAHAWRCGAELGLDALKRHELRGEIGMHRIMTATATCSVLLSIGVLSLPAGTKPPWLIGLPMWTYAVMGGLLPWYWARRNRERPAEVVGTATVPSTSRPTHDFPQVPGPPPAPDDGPA